MLMCRWSKTALALWDGSRRATMYSMLDFPLRNFHQLMRQGSENRRGVRAQDRKYFSMRGMANTCIRLLFLFAGSSQFEKAGGLRKRLCATLRGNRRAADLTLAKSCVAMEKAS